MWVFTGGVLGLHGQVLGPGQVTGVVAVRSCQKLPPCSAEPIPVAPGQTLPGPAQPSRDGATCSGAFPTCMLQAGGIHSLVTSGHGAHWGNELRPVSCQFYSQSQKTSIYSFFLDKTAQAEGHTGQWDSLIVGSLVPCFRTDELSAVRGSREL